MLPQTRGWSCNARALIKSHVITDELCIRRLSIHIFFFFTNEWESYTNLLSKKHKCGRH